MLEEEKEEKRSTEEAKNPSLKLPIEPLIAAPVVLGTPAAMLGVPLVIHALAGAAVGAFTFVAGGFFMNMAKEKALEAKPDENEIIPPAMTMPHVPRCSYSRNDPHIDSPLLASLRR